MSSRPLLKPKVVLPATLANTDLASSATNINMISLVSYDVSWENGVTGTVTVQGCNNIVSPVGVQNNQENSPGSCWVNIPLSAPVTPAGVAGFELIALNNLSFAYIRLFFTDGSGGANIGDITATISGKVS